MKRITISVDEITIKRMKELARLSELNVSQWIRKLIKDTYDLCDFHRQIIEAKCEGPTWGKEPIDYFLDTEEQKIARALKARIAKDKERGPKKAY